MVMTQFTSMKTWTGGSSLIRRPQRIGTYWDYMYGELIIVKVYEPVVTDVLHSANHRVHMPKIDITATERKPKGPGFKRTVNVNDVASDKEAFEMNLENGNE